MRKSAAVFTASVVAGVLALTGCGSSGKTHSSSSAPAPKSSASTGPVNPLTPAQLISALTADGICVESHSDATLEIVDPARAAKAGIKSAGGIECTDNQARAVVDVYGFADPASATAAAQLEKGSNSTPLYSSNSPDATWIANVSSQDSNLAQQAEGLLATFGTRLN